MKGFLRFYRIDGCYFVSLSNKKTKKNYAVYTNEYGQTREETEKTTPTTPMIFQSANFDNPCYIFQVCLCRVVLIGAFIAL